MAAKALAELAGLVEIPDRGAAEAQVVAEMVAPLGLAEQAELAAATAELGVAVKSRN